MEGFVTLSSLFVCSMVLVIVDMASGHMLVALAPMIGALVTGGGITRMVVKAPQPSQRRKD